VFQNCKTAADTTGQDENKFGITMSSVLKGVDERTRLVGHNRLELLLFRLDAKQRYGINVFKVREVVQCPPLSGMPNTHPAVIGVATMRGQTIPIVDLQFAIGGPRIADISKASVVVAEYNRKVQGFLVSRIEHIVNMAWEDILQPPRAAGSDHYLTAVTHVDDELVEILDVERVLYDITGVLEREDVSKLAPVDQDVNAEECLVVVAEDSGVAQKQIRRTLEKVGVRAVLCKDGKEALDYLLKLQADQPDEFGKLILLISDVEMPVMDGYTLVANLRKTPGFQDLKILMHTSLSGVFDSSLLNEVKADGFLSKFDKDELVEIVQNEVNRYFGLPARDIQELQQSKKESS
jgi:two-component system chemotaxis response regulator CheV